MVLPQSQGGTEKFFLFFSAGVMGGYSMEKHLFKTAAFAALCGVKKDTLLHYDHIGLLRPQEVGENGYRYYSARQLATFDIIAALRRLGTPLSEIRAYLNRRNPEGFLELLRQKEAELEAERGRLQRMEDFLAETVRQLELAGGVTPGEIRLEVLPERSLAVVPAPRFEQFEEAQYLLHIRELLAKGRSAGSVSMNPGDIILRESLERDRFMEDYYYCQVPAGSQGAWIQPAGTYAVLYHQGSYQSEYEACRRLRDWVWAQGYTMDGDLYEEDLVSRFSTDDPEAYLIRLSLKIRTPEGTAGALGRDAVDS